MNQYRDKGIVLRTYNLGEADRIVVIMTQDHGKVRAVAKGVRKTRSKIGARLEVLSHVEVLLYKGKGLDTVNQVELIESSAPLRPRSSALTKPVRACRKEPERDKEVAGTPVRTAWSMCCGSSGK